MLSKSRRCYGSVVAALYALAMVMLGLAHQPMARTFSPAADLAAFVLPDGSLPPICGQDGQNIPGDGKAAQHCDACTLSSAPGLLPVAAASVPTSESRLVALDLAEVGQFSPAARHAPLSRGPPLS